jgi:hypothetical protein
MGILEMVGKVAKDVGKGVLDTGKTIKKGIDDNIERQRQKRNHLDRFTMNELKKICSEYGIGEPKPYEEDFLTGEKTKKSLTRDDYIEYIDEKLNLNQIEDFCERHKKGIPYSYQKEKPTISERQQSEPQYVVKARSEDISPQTEAFKTQPETRTEKQHKVENIQQPVITNPTSNEFHEILITIKEQFRPQPCVNEKELQGQLAVWLDVKFPNRATREVSTIAGKIDIGIDKYKYGIEVKIANDKGIMRNLVGQILAYKKYFNEVGIILLDVGEMHNSIIDEYINEYKSHGVETIIIHGQKRGRRGRPREIRVKY